MDARMPAGVFDNTTHQCKLLMIYGTEAPDGERSREENGRTLVVRMVTTCCTHFLQVSVQLCNTLSAKNDKTSVCLRAVQ